MVAKSKKQPVVAISSYDGEYYAFSSSVLVGEWIRMLGGEINHLFLKYFGVNLVGGPLVIHGDNSAVIRMIQEKAISDRARHIQLRWHHMMQAIEDGELEAHGIAGKYNPADMYTKAQDGPTTTKWREREREREGHRELVCHSMPSRLTPAYLAHMQQHKPCMHLRLGSLGHLALMHQAHVALHPMRCRGA